MKFTRTIKKNGDFVRVYKNGRHYAGKHLILHVSGGERDVNALGVSVGRKYGKSVRRNYLKRVIKENYREIEDFVGTGFMFVFAARAAGDAPRPDYYDIRREIGGLFRRAGVLDRQRWDESQKKA